MYKAVTMAILITQLVISVSVVLSPNVIADPNLKRDFEIPKAADYNFELGKTIIIGDEAIGLAAEFLDWISGSGTELDPYIIEDVYVNGNNGTGANFHLEDISKYLEIRNCFFTNSGVDFHDSGIFLNNVSNSLIYNCSFSYNYHNIYIRESKFLEIDRCNIVNSKNVSTGKAILVERSHNLTIEYSNLLNNYDGICMWDSTNCTLRLNQIENYEGDNNTYIPDTGICLIGCNSSNIIENTFIAEHNETFSGLLEEGGGMNIIEGNVGFKSGKAVSKGIQIQNSWRNNILNNVLLTDVIRSTNYPLFWYVALTIAVISSISLAFMTLSKIKGNKLFIRIV